MDVTEPLYFEDVAVGQRWTSPSRTVTETDVVNFAGLTGDYNPLHMDYDFARQTPFGRPIAHGLLGLSLVAGLGSQSPNMHTVAFVEVQGWKFLKPVYFGDTLHVVTEVIDRRPSGRRRGQVTWKRQLLNQDGEVVQEGVFVTLVSVSPADRSSTSRETGDSAAGVSQRSEVP